MNRFILLALVLLTATVLAGCGKSSKKAKNVEKNSIYAKQGGATPEEAFAGLVKYYEDGKVRGAMLQWLAPEFRAPMVLDLYMGLKRAAVDDQDLRPDFIAVKKKHGISDLSDLTKDMKPEDLSDIDKLKALAKKVFKDQDLPALVDDLIPLMKKIGAYPIEFDPRPLRVEKVEITGRKKNKADGRIIFDDTSASKVEFVKIGGRWFVLPWE